MNKNLFLERQPRADKEGAGGPARAVEPLLKGQLAFCILQSWRRRHCAREHWRSGEKSLVAIYIRSEKPDCARSQPWLPVRKLRLNFRLMSRRHAQISRNLQEATLRLGVRPRWLKVSGGEAAEARCSVHLLLRGGNQRLEVFISWPT